MNLSCFLNYFIASHLTLIIFLAQVMASKTKIYIVLEFVTGGELFDKIVRYSDWFYLISMMQL